MTNSIYSQQPRFQRLPEVIERIGAKKSTIYRWIANKQFPAPIRIGENISVWEAKTIDRWMADRIENAGGAK